MFIYKFHVDVIVNLAIISNLVIRTHPICDCSIIFNWIWTSIYRVQWLHEFAIFVEFQRRLLHWLFVFPNGWFSENIHWLKVLNNKLQIISDIKSTESKFKSNWRQSRILTMTICVRAIELSRFNALPYFNLKCVRDHLIRQADRSWRVSQIMCKLKKR